MWTAKSGVSKWNPICQHLMERLAKAADESESNGSGLSRPLVNERPFRTSKHWLCSKTFCVGVEDGLHNVGPY